MTAVPNRGNLVPKKGGDANLNAAFNQRMPEDLHKRIKSLAKDYGVSMNELVNMACEEFALTGRLPELEKRVSELEKEVKDLKTPKK